MESARQSNKMPQLDLVNRIESSSQYSQSLEPESATSEGSAVESDHTAEQKKLQYRYSKNPFANLATASWQPLSVEEMQQIVGR